MDFVLNSSDSEYVDSPQVSKTRPGMKHRDLAPLTPATGNATSGVKIENGRLYLGDARRAAIMQSELQAVYDKLDTPRAPTARALGPTRGGGIRTGSSISGTPTLKSKNSFDVSKERMKLANIIDSETNADDTADSLFLRPITMQGPLENTPKRLIYDAESPGSALRRPRNHDLDPLDVRFNDFSDAEDLLAEFSKPSFSRVENQKSSRLAPVDDSPALPGRLLHVDSTSEHSTPRYQGIRDELDQSRTRFRQSINALLNSSPISATSVERSVVTSITDLVKVGSKLSEQVISDMAASEKTSGQFAGARDNLVLAKGERVLDSKSLVDDVAPRRMTLEELRHLKPTDASVAKLREASFSPKLSSRRVAPVAGRLLRRVFWALLMLSLFIFMDLSLQIMISRQDAGLPVIDPAIFHVSLSEQWHDWISWMYSKIGGSLHASPIPH